MAGVLYVAFILTNTAFIWVADKPWIYLLISIGLSVLYVFLIGLISTGYCKLVETEGSGESGMIFLVVMYHPVLLLLVILIKWLYFKLFI
jgi:hypothetical protein